jgi:hypothetical protein
MNVKDNARKVDPSCGEGAGRSDCYLVPVPSPPAVGERAYAAPRIRRSGREGRTIGWCGQAKGARRQRDHGHSVVRHVEELDRVAFVAHPRYGMTLHDRADVAGTEAALLHIAGQNHVAIHFEGHTYLGYMVINRGTQDGKAMRV